MAFIEAERGVPQRISAGWFQYLHRDPLRAGRELSLMGSITGVAACHCPGDRRRLADLVRLARQLPAAGAVRGRDRVDGRSTVAGDVAAPDQDAVFVCRHDLAIRFGHSASRISRLSRDFDRRYYRIIRVALRRVDRDAERDLWIVAVRVWRDPRDQLGGIHSGQPHRRARPDAVRFGCYNWAAARQPWRLAVCRWPRLLDLLCRTCSGLSVP